MAPTPLHKQGTGKRETIRERVWRNMMVLTINEGVQRNILSLSSSKTQPVDFTEPYVYKFTVQNEIAAIASIKDIGYGEYAVRVAFWPTERAEEIIRSSNGWSRAGDAYARGWLSRDNGLVLKGFDGGLCCRKHLIQSVADIQVCPLGYEDRGPKPGYVQLG